MTPPGHRVHFLLPAGWDDPRRPSGGNYYDQRIRSELGDSGWQVRTVVAPASPAPTDRTLADVLAAIPDGSTVLADGLIVSAAADQVVGHLPRLRLTVLLHMPLVTAFGREHDERGRASEAAVLAAATNVVVTSRWSQQELIRHYGLAPERIHVAVPGAESVESMHAAARRRAVAPTRRNRLLCVGVLAPHKGQDLLIDALVRLGTRGGAGSGWACLLVGADDVDPGFAAMLRSRVVESGLSRQVRFAGVLERAALHRAYVTAGLLVAPSRAETYGMAVSEALGHGLPVLASDVGGLPEALGYAVGGDRPGELIAPGDPDELAATLRRWRDDNAYRGRIESAARGRRALLPTWTDTVRAIASAISGADAAPGIRS